jgi:hypothetical protein
VLGWKRPLDGAWAGYKESIRDMIEWLKKLKILKGSGCMSTITNHLSISTTKWI